MTPLVSASRHVMFIIHLLSRPEDIFCRQCTNICLGASLQVPKSLNFSDVGNIYECYDKILSHFLSFWRIPDLR
jgi:hypothetical protein